MLIDQRFGVPIAAGLTGMPDKASLYAVDMYFREGWEDLVVAAGDAAAALAFRHALVLVKPEALVSRKLDAVLAWLTTHGFSVVAHAPVAVCHRQVQALWRYEWNSAPRIRRDASAALFGASESCLLVVRSTQNAHVPAAKQLGDLRARFAHTTPLLDFVHLTDDAADLVRELAVLLPQAHRTAIHARMRDGLDTPAGELRAMAARLCEGLPTHSLDLQEALQHIETLIRASADMNIADRETATEICVRAGTGAAADWRVLFGLLDRWAIRYEPWDRLTIAAHTSNVSHPQLKALLPRAVALAQPA